MKLARSPENKLLDSELCSWAFSSQRKAGSTTFCSIKMLATPRKNQTSLSTTIRTQLKAPTAIHPNPNIIQTLDFSHSTDRKQVSIGCKVSTPASKGISSSPNNCKKKETHNPKKTHLDTNLTCIHENK